VFLRRFRKTVGWVAGPPFRVGLFCRKKARDRGQGASPCGAKLPGTPSPQEGLDPSIRPRVESHRRPIGSSLWLTIHNPYPDPEGEEEGRILVRDSLLGDC